MMFVLVPAAFAAPTTTHTIAYADSTQQVDSSTAGTASEAPGNSNPLIPNPLEVIPMLVGFLVLLLILWKFGWPVIIKSLDGRVTRIKDSIEQAENARMESAKLLEEHKAQLDDAKRQAAQIIAEAKQSGEAVKAEITAKAQVEAEAMIAKARVAIETEKKAAIAELQGSVAELSVSVAGRLIGQDLSEGDHRKMIEHYLSEAGALNAN